MVTNSQTDTEHRRSSGYEFILLFVALSFSDLWIPRKTLPYSHVQASLAFMKQYDEICERFRTLFKLVYFHLSPIHICYEFMDLAEWTNIAPEKT